MCTFLNPMDKTVCEICYQDAPETAYTTQKLEQKKKEDNDSTNNNQQENNNDKEEQKEQQSQQMIKNLVLNSCLIELDGKQRCADIVVA